jgi:hypothetical protein
LERGSSFLNLGKYDSALADYAEALNRNFNDIELLNAISENLEGVTKRKFEELLTAPHLK